VEATGAVAAVDCGTNSTRLLVVGASGAVLAREMTITRLGQGVDATRQLRPDAMERTFTALRTYRAVMDAHGVDRARLVATSAARDAENGHEFLGPAASIVGVPAEVLSGAEEGRLSYEGATEELPSGGQVFVLDIGGGSTELVTEDGGAVVSASLDIGCVRVTERYLRGDPPQPHEVTQALDAVRTELARAAQIVPGLVRPSAERRLVGLAGTVSTLASLELGLAEYQRDRIHHSVLSLDAVTRWCSELGAEPVAARARRPGITEGREDVILGGALVLRTAMEQFGFERCIVSESDILDGLVRSVATPLPKG
jgi:exopolyphosphatase / guanosine-5'-triphosphate,3'-diphosphate pyrophosphatase